MRCRPRLLSPLLLLGFGLTWSLVAQAKDAPTLRPVVRSAEAPTHLIAKGKGSATLLLNQSTGAERAAMNLLVLAPGAAVPEHAHAKSVEILYIQQGRVEMNIGGRRYEAGAGDAVYIPAGMKHSARVLGHTRALEAVQLYVGPGPEQRFTRGEKVDGP